MAKNTPEPIPEATPDKDPRQVIDAWFDGHIRPMAHRFTADVYNDLQASKEALIDLF